MALKKLIDEVTFAIISGEFLPRQRLIEMDMAKRFNVGRGAIRDCLRILADRGLVTAQSNKGALVADFSPNDVVNLYFLRTQLELMACALAFDNMDRDKIDEMKLLQDNLRHNSLSHPDMIQAHEMFHDVIFRAASNDFLRSVIQRLIALTGVVRYQTYSQEVSRASTLAQHDALLDALNHKDKSKLLEACRHHLRSAMVSYLETYHQIQAPALIAEFDKNMEASWNS